MNLTYNDHLTFLEFLARQGWWVLGLSVLLTMGATYVALEDARPEKRPHLVPRALRIFVPVMVVLVTLIGVTGWSVKRSGLNQDRFVEQVHAVYGAEVQSFSFGLYDGLPVSIVLADGRASECTVTPVKSRTRTHVLLCNGTEPLHHGG